MECFGLEVHVVSFLADVSRSQKLSHFFLDVAEDWSEFLQSLGLHAGYCPGEWRIYQNLVAHIEGEISELVQTPVVKVSSVATVSSTTHQNCQKNDSALLSCLVETTSTVLVTGQVTGTVGTKGTSVTNWRVKYPIPVQKLEIPFSKGGDTRTGIGSHGLIPLLRLLHDIADVNLDILHVLDGKAAFHLIHLVTSFWSNICI